MKQNILCFVGILLCVTNLTAQVRFGIRAGLNLADLAGNGFRASDMKPTLLPSYHFGGTAEFGISENFSLETGLFMSGKGIKFTSNLPIGTATVSFMPVYLEIPFNALYKADLGHVKLHFLGGPYVDFGITGKFKMILLGETIYENLRFGSATNSSFKAFDLGFNLGWGIEISHFIIRGQYGLGWTNVDAQNRKEREKRHRVIGISLGYMFGGS